MKNFLLGFLIFNTTLLLSFDEVLSKKNLLEYDSGRVYKRGTYLIVLSNPVLYDYFQNYTLSQFAWSFIELKKTQGVYALVNTRSFSSFVVVVWV